MQEYGSLPRARHGGLLKETVGEELLLYDQDSHTAHCLSPIAACVWRHCDGKHDLAELAVLAGVSESLVANALHELREKDLLAVEPELRESAVVGESRREAIGRAARYAATAAAPFVVSAVAATPAMAESGKCPPNACVSMLFGKCCICQNECCNAKLNDETECKEWCEKQRSQIKGKFLTEVTCVN